MSERRVLPAERAACGGNLVLAERRAVAIGVSCFGHRTLADDRLAAHERRTLGGVRLTERRVDRVDIVAIDITNDLPAVRLEALRRVLGEPAASLAVDRDPVVVVEHHELRKT